MSGLEVLRTLARDGTVPGLPVVMFSSSEAGRREALRLGARGFAIKGGSEEELIALVRQHAITRERAAG